MDFHGFLVWIFMDFSWIFSWISHAFLVWIFSMDFSCISCMDFHGFSWISHGFLMDFSWISHGFLMDFLMDFSWIFSWIFHGFLMDFSWIFSWISHAFLVWIFSMDFLYGFSWISCMDFLMDFLYGFLMHFLYGFSPWISCMDFHGFLVWIFSWISCMDFSWISHASSLTLQADFFGWSFERGQMFFLNFDLQLLFLFSDGLRQGCCSFFLRMPKKKGRVCSHLKEIRKKRWKPKFTDLYYLNGKK
jgi:hypothetical protein